LLKDCSSLLNDAFLRAQQHARIKIALKRHTVTDPDARFADRCSPVDTEDVRPGSCHPSEYRRAPIQIKNARNASADSIEDFLSVWQSELLVILAVQLACPGIEQLNDLCTRFDLKQEIGTHCRRQLIQQRMKHAWFAVSKSFDLGKVLRSAAFDHVRRQCPG